MLDVLSVFSVRATPRLGFAQLPAKFKTASVHAKCFPCKVHATYSSRTVKRFLPLHRIVLFVGSVHEEALVAARPIRVVRIRGTKTSGSRNPCLKTVGEITIHTSCI